MATTQELLDKLRANLTSIYDKLESKGVQVSGNKNLDNLVLAIDNIGGGVSGDKNLIDEPVFIELESLIPSDGVDVIPFVQVNKSLGLVVGKEYVVRYLLDGQEKVETVNGEEYPMLDGTTTISLPLVVDENCIPTNIVDNVKYDNEKHYLVQSDNSFVLDFGNSAVELVDDMGYSTFELLSIKEVQPIIADLYEFSSPNEMEAFKTEENLGKYAKYVGETTDTYTNGSIYYVKESGGNIAILNKDNYDSNFGTSVVLYDGVTLSHPFSNGDSVIVVASVDGETSEYPAKLVDMGGMELIASEETLDSGVLLLKNDSDMFLATMLVLNMNPMKQTIGQGYMLQYQVKEGNTLPEDYYPNVEIISIKKEVEGGEAIVVTNPILYEYVKYVSLAISPYPIATPNQIKEWISAYNDKGELLVGSMRNPQEISSEEELAEVFNDDTSGGVYKITNTFGNYEMSGGVFMKVRQTFLSPVVSVENLCQNQNDIGFYTKKLQISQNEIDRPYAFAYCQNIFVVEFLNEGGSTLSLSNHLFLGCANLKAVIIPYEAENFNLTGRSLEGIFDETPIANGEGYIYVPNSLVDVLKNNEYFSPYANQIKPIGEYVEE